MSKRKTIGKKIRFEVFKRDSFTCQYCGAHAPEVVLHLDHIKPVAKGGEDDVMNYVTSCQGCNAGKGARELSDASIIEKQRRQLEELNERREQLEMMLQWRDALKDEAAVLLEHVVEHIGDISGYTPNEKAQTHIRRWLKTYSFEEIVEAVDASFDRHFEPTNDAKREVTMWETAWKKIPAYLKWHRRYGKDGSRLAYIQAILRNKLDDRWGEYIPALNEMRLDGVPLDILEIVAKDAPSWEEFCETINNSGTQGLSGVTIQ